MAKRNATRTQDPAAAQSVGHFVRALLGLTQQELAWLLGTSRVALAKDESGQRLLPREAGRRLSDLARQLHTLPPLPVGPPTPPDDAQRATLAQRQLGIKLEEYPLRQRLAQAHQHLAQQRRCQQAAAVLLAAVPAADTRAHRALASLLARADASLPLAATEPLLLELRLRVLAFEQAELARLLGETNPATTPPAA